MLMPFSNNGQSTGMTGHNNYLVFIGKCTQERREDKSPHLNALIINTSNLFGF